MRRIAILTMLLAAAACGNSTKGNPDQDSDSDGDAAGGDGNGDGPGGDSTSNGDGDSDGGPIVEACPILPANHVFNSRIDGLDVHPNSAAFLATIGNHNVHLDLGTETDQTSPNYYGIPYNFVDGSTLTWTHTSYDDPDTATESDCAVSTDPTHTTRSPCTGAALTTAVFPIPANVKVEGGISDDLSIYGDHHMLLVDTKACELWELGNSYQLSSGWQTSWTAYYDLRSNALRPQTWSSADAAGFPIFPLLMRQEEAASGEIKHAFRFTINSDKIRTSYVWPARHKTNNGTGSTDLPQMGQLFRLKSTYTVPSGISAQSRAIIVALKQYGMYLADGGSDMYITGSPSAAWDDDLLDVVQALETNDFEAVNLEAQAAARSGFNVNSGALP